MQNNTVTALAAGLQDLLFVLVPLFVVGLVEYLDPHGSAWRLASSPEWAFAAVVLMGQAVLRFGRSMLGQSANTERSGLAMAALVTGGILSSIILALMIESREQPSSRLVISQCAAFLLGAAAFVLVAGAAHSLKTHSETIGFGRKTG